ncbi:MAG TPA: OadG family protein [Firmicutes bacterium]|nr:OadG family protein [Bacillota bacterium]
MKELIVLGMEVTGIGLTVVFLSLFALYLIMVLFGKLFPKEKPKSEPQKEPIVSLHVEEEDTEVVAVINAAIMAYLQRPSPAATAGEAFLPALKGKKSKWSANARLYLLQARRELNILRRRK